MNKGWKLVAVMFSAGAVVGAIGSVILDSAPQMKYTGSFICYIGAVLILASIGVGIYNTLGDV